MISEPGRRRSSCAGQSLVEIALVMPLLAMLLVSLFEFSMVLYAHVQVANAAREGARAASLYRTTRYSTITNLSNPPSCSAGIRAWSVIQVASQAIVSRELANNGCPDADGAITATSLGWLDPVPAPDTWAVTIDIAQQADAPSTPDDESMPTPGVTPTLTLRYPYRLLILSSLVPALRDPLWISKSVQFEYQQ